MVLVTCRDRIDISGAILFLGDVCDCTTFEQRRREDEHNKKCLGQGRWHLPEIVHNIRVFDGNDLDTDFRVDIDATRYDHRGEGDFDLLLPSISYLSIVVAGHCSLRGKCFRNEEVGCEEK